jgi:hypothetical protein
MEDCEIYRPTLEEFSSFKSYILQIQNWCQKGICKIIPPSEWKDISEIHSCDIKSLKDFKVPTPSQQVISGKAGVYEVDMFEMKDMTIGEIYEYSINNKCNDPDPHNREKVFWKTLV